MSYSSRIMNIPPVRVGDSDGMKMYRIGHRDARHAAAEIASEAEGEILYLGGALSATQSLLDRAITLIPEPEDMEWIIAMARNAPGLLREEHDMIDRLEGIWVRL